MIEITMEEILEDLCYPFPPPGRWPDVSRDAPADPGIVAFALPGGGQLGAPLAGAEPPRHRGPAALEERLRGAHAAPERARDLG